MLQNTLKNRTVLLLGLLPVLLLSIPLLAQEGKGKYCTDKNGVVLDGL